MKIGIIGAGNIGAGLANRLVQLGHEVTLSNSRGPSSLLEVAATTGARPGTVSEAAREARLVIVAIPEKAVSSLPKGVLEGVEVVADTGNYYPGRDGVIPELASQTITESEWVAKTLERPVVKVFNNILAQSLVGSGQPKGAPSRIALPVAGDDIRAKGLLAELVDELGFEPVDGGRLADSWRQQPGTPVYCTERDASAAIRALEAAVRSESPARRDRSWAEFVANPGLSHAQALERIRALW